MRNVSVWVVYPMHWIQMFLWLAGLSTLAVLGPPFFIGIYRLVKEFHHVLLVRFVIIQKWVIFQMVVHFQGMNGGWF